MTNILDFKKNGFPLAVIFALIIGLVPLPGLSHAGHMTIALLIFAIVMWASETFHLAVTSLIILFIQPILGICSFTDAVVHFANPIIFLMIGGFIMAEGIRESGLVRRLTYNLLNKFGTTSTKAIFVCVFATGILSAWIENIIAFALIMPIIAEIIDLMKCKNAHKGESNMAKALILGACFASLAGGIATEIGTAPNLIAAAYTNIPFINWLVFGIPISIVLLTVIWKLLGFIFPPEVDGIEDGKKVIQEKLNEIGKITKREKIAFGILIFAIILWITTGITGLDSYSVALIGASLFFLFRISDWRQCETNIDWGLVVFFGGALSLGAAILNTGAAQWLINDIIALLGSNPATFLVVIVLMIVAVSITQVMSNVALAAILVPLSVTLAQSQDLAVGIYAVPIAIACSLSFLLPMADPTVAMAYGTNYVNIKEIFKAGLPIVVVGIIVTIVVMFTFAQPFLV
ncbi:MAG: DASS family sodium-coupled anion symporter [Methanobacteriaceae archaeon]|jgi:sodium-dependent dicarboxylate transporter 2/3/5|nr:DASS family sodium-coupled anion symporter [Methanobacteriaceae archaeon]